LALVALFFSAGAHAITQPSGGSLVVPIIDIGKLTCEDKNIERCIDASELDATLIAAVPDALVAPEVFQPSCNLTFKPLVKGGGDHVAFGWYNVKPDPAMVGKFLKPLKTELYGMFNLPRGNTSGATLATLPEGQAAALDLAAEEAAGRYKGGAIGFFLAARGNITGIDPATRNFIGITGHNDNDIYYTQHELNAGSAGASTYYQVLTWQSVHFPNSFYFGWEDQTASGSSDNDFDDLLFLVSGIQCSGGGEPCDTMLKGVCALGAMQCKKGELTCVQSIASTPEECNALDDDCNGEVDDGNLCKAGKICDRGRCVPKCGTAEFRCAVGLACNPRGVCVEKACLNLDCPVGQVCKAGACIDSCGGVTCPYGNVCRNGGCVDPCIGIECDEGFSCELGVCRSCECSACAGGKVCQATTNVCVDTGCETQACAAGTHCVAGACVEDCTGAKCPSGQLCQVGECVPDPNGISTGAGGEGGTDVPDPVLDLPTDPNGGTTNGGTSTTGGSKGEGATGAVIGQGAAPGEAAGCGCSVPRQSRAGALAVLLLAAGLGLRRRKS